MPEPKRAHGQIRRSQVITTYGPGALIDLPEDAGIVGGLDHWGNPSALDAIDEPRLSQKLARMTDTPNPRLLSPPRAPDGPWEKAAGLRVWRFPEWFVVQEKEEGQDNQRSRRLVHLKRTDDGKGRRFEGRRVVPTRFVRACPKGHVDDVDWYAFVHGPDDNCKKQLWMVERGTTGDLIEMFIRCDCGARRAMSEAAQIDVEALGHCSGHRPWLGPHARESCGEPARLLIRSASNAYFPQVVGLLSLPDRGSDLDRIVGELWHLLRLVEDAAALAVMKRDPDVTEKLAAYTDEEILAAIDKRMKGGDDDRPAKHVELDAILAVPEGFDEDVPRDPSFHARRLPETVWRRHGGFPSVRSVIQLHRLREVMALAGFTRLEAIAPDVNGEYDTDVVPARLSIDADWFPAVENRGEGIFVELDPRAVKEWSARPQVDARLRDLQEGFRQWAEQRKSKREFPGGPYVLLHTLSHLLIQSVALRCGYPASSIRERVYADTDAERFGVLLYTGSPDAEGTLGGLVQQGRHLVEHLRRALDLGGLCSNDPVCAEHQPTRSSESRPLHGAACHGCVLIAETSCEMRNDLLDRALVVPVLGLEDAAFFRPEDLA